MSNVGVEPTSNSKARWLLSNSVIVEIQKISCKDNNYWGYAQNGWIYISNPKYGKLIDEKGNRLPMNYNFWCKD